MKYLSICSGIEAASVAWHPLGWEPLAFSEIEPFPRAVLAHHYPDTPLHGDFTVLRHEPWIVDADVLVGGTPCQAFSVAGLRNSLADDRGNLSLEYIKLADSIDAAREADGRDPCIVVWENVPGVLSVKDNAFGCFISALAGDVEPYVPPRGKWTNAGVVDGPARQVAWRILDAQYFGLAQRRKRCFVVASARDGFDPAEVLFEFEGVQRNTPPRREAGQIAPTIPSRSTAGGGLGTDFDLDGGVIQSTARMVAFGEYSDDGTASTLKSRDYKDATDLVAHTLKGEGFDASEDGTGRGTPLVPVAYSIMPMNSGKDYKAREVEVAQPIMAGGPVGGNQGGDYVMQPVAVPLQEVGKRTGVSTNDPRAGIGIGKDGDPMFTLQAGAQHGVVTSGVKYAHYSHDYARDRITDVDGVNPALTKEAHASGNLNIAYAFQPRIARNGRGDMGDVVNALNAQSGETGKGDAAPCVAVGFQSSQSGVRLVDTHATLDANNGPRHHNGVMQHMAVRRLTPVECERLQGFPDGYTNIPWRKKTDAPDGPRYKALGNSMAVPCMRWIGRRIAEYLK